MALDPTTYLAASAVTGVIQVIDGFVLLRGTRRPQLLASLFSLFESVWAVVSYYTWRAADEKIPAWLPMSFMVYVAASFVLGFVLVARARDRRDRSIPPYAAAAGSAFGVYFALASAFHLA